MKMTLFGMIFGAALLVVTTSPVSAQQEKKYKKPPSQVGWTWEKCYKRQKADGKSNAEASTWCNEGARRVKAGEAFSR